MKIQFEDNQPHQLDGIQAVVDLFEGQRRLEPSPLFNGEADGAGVGAGLVGVHPNRLELNADDILANLKGVQKGNGIHPDTALKQIEAPAPVAGTDGQPAPMEGNANFFNFSLDMETGTGKTYVYLRTALTLFERYGLCKFIIVVPSIAIREGVVSSLRLTREHFLRMFNNTPYRSFEYDSGNLNQVKEFAVGRSVQIMVMTIDSFTKDTNKIRQSPDGFFGQRPLSFIQAARPIVIMDEPQNMETPTRRAAIASLNPLFTLRYSATHANPYNIVYRLTPAQAYRDGLVKKVQVASVLREHDVTSAYIRVDDVKVVAKRPAAVLTLDVADKKGAIKRTALTLKYGADLRDETGRAEYEGLKVGDINVLTKTVPLSSTLTLRKGDESGMEPEAVIRAQLEITIKAHIEHQERWAARGIKVLSLFFISRVDDYAPDDAPLRKMFEETFDKLRKASALFKGLKPSEVHAGYFAFKKKKDGTTEQLDSATGDAATDASAYDLIMRDKESLLSFPADTDDAETKAKRQVRFIFSHSALREGWDNPNVFQVCVLRSVNTERVRRQQVGRGVRIAVDQKGVRVRDEGVNVLTVVANEHYQQFIDGYQDDIAAEFRAEIEARCGKDLSTLTPAERRRIEREYGKDILPPPPANARESKGKLRKKRLLSADFQELWKRIRHKTRYDVTVDTDKLVAACGAEIDRADVKAPRVAYAIVPMDVSKGGAFEAMHAGNFQTMQDLWGRVPLPDVLDVMMGLLEQGEPRIRLTRATLLRVVQSCTRLEMLTKNPHEWASAAVKVIRDKLAEHLVDGVQYVKMSDVPEASRLTDDDKYYAMKLIEDEDVIEVLTSNAFRPDESQDRTIYTVIPCVSGPERDFAKGLDKNPVVKLYVKLPAWFEVDTPVGKYRPDWAVVCDGPEAKGKPVLYLIAETKGTTDTTKRRPMENLKIRFAERHFGCTTHNVKGALEGVDYKDVTAPEQVPW
jgi:type III restriction enzyme